MSDAPVSRTEFSNGIESLRSEFQAGLTTAGVQIGAVEKTLKERLSSLKAWSLTALVGGQAFAAVTSKVISGDVTAPARATAHAVSRLLT
jgi:hypothetical protein